MRAINETGLRESPSAEGFPGKDAEEQGYAVETAGDGATALERIRTARPDLLVLDLMMPVLDGWGVLRELRGGAGPPVVLLSAAADPRRAIREGAAASLVKPFAIEDLVATCSRVLRRVAEGNRARGRDRDDPAGQPARARFRP